MYMCVCTGFSFFAWCVSLFPYRVLRHMSCILSCPHWTKRTVLQQLLYALQLFHHLLFHLGAIWLISVRFSHSVFWTLNHSWCLLLDLLWLVQSFLWSAPSAAEGAFCRGVPTAGWGGKEGHAQLMACAAVSLRSWTYFRLWLVSRPISSV